MRPEVVEPGLGLSRSGTSPGRSKVRDASERRGPALPEQIPDPVFNRKYRLIQNGGGSELDPSRFGVGGSAGNVLRFGMFLEEDILCPG